MQARFAKGTFARIAAVLSEGESRTDFVREAVQNELERREGGANVVSVKVKGKASNRERAA